MATQKGSTQEPF